MLEKLIRHFRGTYALTVHLLSLSFCGLLFITVAGIRKLSPKKFYDSLTWLLYQICNLYFASFDWIFFITTRTKLEIIGLEKIKKKGSYLLISNHLSALDIILLEKIFFRLIAPLKFFVKRELLWLPIIGWVLCALDYPAMYRYNKKQLRKNPALKGMDRITTQKACQRFLNTPMTFVNFAEGTRYTPKRHALQKTPYHYVLKPKSGGISIMLSALHQQFDGILDVTLIYPTLNVSTWDFLCGKYANIKILVDVLPITPDLIGAQQDMDYRKHIQAWLDQRFAHKDSLIAEHLSQQQKRSVENESK